MLYQLVVSVLIVILALYLGGRQMESALHRGIALGKDLGYHVGWLDGSSDAVELYFKGKTVKDWMTTLSERRLARFDDHLLVDDEDDSDDGDDDDPQTEPAPEVPPTLTVIPDVRVAEHPTDRTGTDG